MFTKNNQYIENTNTSDQNDSSILNSFIEGKSYNAVNANPARNPQNSAEMANSIQSNKLIENIPVGKEDSIDDK